MSADQLLVMVPTRGRPDNCKRLVDAWRDTTTGAHLLLVFDDDDETRTVAVHRSGLGQSDRGRTDPHNVRWVSYPRQGVGMTAPLNAAAISHCRQYTYLGFMGDDHVPRTLAWDAQMCAALEMSPFAYGNDLLQGERLATAIFMRSKVVDTLGWMAPPKCRHLYLDDCWMELGSALGITYLPEAVIEHVHPFAGKAELDEGYQAVNNDEMVEHDQAGYQEWRADHMDADIECLRAAL